MAYYAALPYITLEKSGEATKAIRTQWLNYVWGGSVAVMLYSGLLYWISGEILKGRDRG
jgi:hypothetical protein